MSPKCQQPTKVAQKVTLASLDIKLDYLTKLVQKTDEAVHGNGKEGLVTKVDRLEQIETSRKWTVRALVSSMLVGLVGLLIKFIGG